MGTESHVALATVSVVVPCYNHGRFLEECLASVDEQDYPAHEVIIVDDGSTDAATRAVIDHLPARPGRVVIRQENRGPSGARNRGAAAATGSSVLFLDADNRLRATALRALVSARWRADPQVRWVYQHQHFFGGRSGLTVHPEFNLALLMERNFCDTCALVDRSVFDEGIRFREDIGLGHEDWDFFLSLADAGYTGVPCPGVHLEVRKHGFTRSDLIEHITPDYEEQLRRLQPALYEPNRRLALKRRWAPALSIIRLVTIHADHADDLASWDDLLSRQTCLDTEIVDVAAALTPLGGLDDCATAIAAARGRWVLVLPAANVAVFGDPTFVEKVLRLATHVPLPHAVLFARRGADATGADLAPGPGPGEELSCAGLVASASLLEFIGAESLRSVPSIVSGISAIPQGHLSARWVSSALPAGVPVRLPPGRAWAALGTNRASMPHDVVLSGSPDPGATIADAGVLERWYRRREAEPIFGSPVVGRGIAPWLDPVDRETDKRLPTAAWTPPGARPVMVVFDPVAGDIRLASEAQPSVDAVVVGHLQVHRAPGALPVWMRVDPVTRRPAYGVGPWSRGDATVIGHASTAAFWGMIDLFAAANRFAATRWTHLGRPGPPPTLDVTAATHPVFVDPPQLLPAAGQDALGTRSLWWRLLEGPDLDEPTGGRDYRLHPDLLAHPQTASQWQPVASLRDPASGPELLLVSARSSSTRQRCPSAQLGEVDGKGDPEPRVLGALLPIQEPGTVPMFRLYASAGDLHRLSLDPGAAPDEVCEGLIGFARRPPVDSGPLFRWRHRHRPMWRYSWDGPLLDDDFVLEGTLGLAVAPARSGDLIGLVEVYHRESGVWTSACGEPSIRFLEDAGFVRRRTVACLLPSTTRTGFPLFSLALTGGSRVLCANPSEFAAESGYTIEGIVGGLEACVPPPWTFNAAGSCAAVASDMHDRVVAGLTPFSTPVYRASDPAGRESVTGDLSTVEARGERVVSIAGYLPGTTIVPEQRPTDPVPPRVSDSVASSEGAVSKAAGALRRIESGYRRLAERRPSRRPPIDPVLPTQSEEFAFDATGVANRFPPGYYYSAIPDSRELLAEPRRSQVWPHQPRETPGIDWRPAAQVALCTDVFGAQERLAFVESADPEGDRYYLTNGQYPPLDAWVLEAMLRWLRPRRMVEVGSGYSSLLTARVNREHLGLELDFVCIEPNPRSFLSRGVEGISSLLAEQVQDVELSTFTWLQSGDILFIDSSHTVKTGSDVVWLTAEVLPRLAPGVVVHMHDIFLPGDYPEAWVAEGWGWNENYLVRALLTFTSGFEVVFSVPWMRAFHPDVLRAAFPDGTPDPTSAALWLRRI